MCLGLVWVASERKTLPPFCNMEYQFHALVIRVLPRGVCLRWWKEWVVSIVNLERGVFREKCPMTFIGNLMPFPKNCRHYYALVEKD